MYPIGIEIVCAAAVIGIAGIAVRKAERRVRNFAAFAVVGYVIMAGAFIGLSVLANDNASVSALKEIFRNWVVAVIDIPISIAFIGAVYQRWHFAVTHPGTAA